MKRAAAPIGMSIGFVFLTTLPAFAHAELRSADPPRDGTVGTAPENVSATFTEPLSSTSSLQIFDACGDRVDAGGPATSGRRISIGLDSAAAGRYRVRYFVISEVDGHPSRGTYTFDVSSGSSCAAAAGGSGDEAEGGGMFDIPLGDLLMGLGLAALIGAAGGHVYAGILGKRT